MSVKLTREGKQCKLCLKKGGPCHIHAGKAVAKAAPPKKAKAPAKRAAKKARSKAKAKAKSRVVSTGVDRFATLPKDALTLILLAMDRPELTKVRKLSKRARAVSDTSSFKDQYHTRHPTKFFEGTKMMSHMRLGNIHTYRFRDSKGKSVLIKGRDVDAEDDSHTFMVEWMGYSTTPMPEYIPSKARRPSVKQEWEKEIHYKELKPNTVIQSQRTIINEAIQLLTEELEDEGVVYDIVFD